MEVKTWAKDRIYLTMVGLGLPTISKEGLVLLLLLSAGEMILGAQTIDGIDIRDSRASSCKEISQHPRFVAKKRDSLFEVTCHVSHSGEVSWLLKQESDPDPRVLKLDNERLKNFRSNNTVTLVIQKVQFEDNGIYYCQQACVENPEKMYQGCGTELRVMGYSTVAQLKRRNTLKDAIIMIQTLLIIVFITVPIFLLLDKDDSKVALEDDHTYEGLEIDQTATYEDIVTLRTGEVKWSVGEHPGQE